MQINIRDLMDNIEDSSVEMEEANVVSSERIKELTRMKINELGATSAPKHGSKKKIVTVLVAAAVVSALGLSAYAALNGGLGGLTFGKSSWGPSIEEDIKHSMPGREYVSTVGYADSAEYKATAEWIAFDDSYDRDSKIVDAFEAECRRTGVDPFAEKYGDYLIYSQEMADKVDEITAKYNLKLHKNITDCDEKVLKDKCGDVFSDGITGGGYMYEDGTFQLDCTYKNCEFQIRRCMKGYFDTTFLNVGDIGKFEQWTYVTKEGYTVSCSLRNDGYGLITIDLEDCFISINVLTWDSDMNKVVHTKAEIEELVDQMKFSKL